MVDSKLLTRGDQLPHFEVTTVEGSECSYSSIWQRKNLLLVLLGASSAVDVYVSSLRARESAFHDLETACVVTSEDVAGLPALAVVIADRWGEILYIDAAPRLPRSPSPEDLLGWLEYVQHRCPECEGEAR
jgi:peroxiredoxin